MRKIGCYLLWALTACCLCHGSWAEDPQSAFVCLVDEPDTNQFESNCLTEFQPLLEQFVKAQNEGKTHDVGIQAKLSNLEGQQAKLEGQLKGVEAKLEKHLQELQTKLEESLANLEINLLARLGNPPQAVLNKVDKQRQIMTGFKRIGTRYIRIINEYATDRCEELDGSLATFLTEEEFHFITKKLNKENQNHSHICTTRGFSDGLWTDFCNNRHYIICVA